MCGFFVVFAAVKLLVPLFCRFHKDVMMDSLTRSLTWVQICFFACEVCAVDANSRLLSQHNWPALYTFLSAIGS